MIKEQFKNIEIAALEKQKHPCPVFKQPVRTVDLLLRGAAETCWLWTSDVLFVQPRNKVFEVRGIMETFRIMQGVN